MEVYNAFTGTQMRLEGPQTRDLDSVKHELAAAGDIEPGHMLLLVAPQGQPLKTEGLSTAREVFLFDKTWIDTPPPEEPARGSAANGSAPRGSTASGTSTNGAAANLHDAGTNGTETVQSGLQIPLDENGTGDAAQAISAHGLTRAGDTEQDSESSTAGSTDKQLTLRLHREVTNIVRASEIALKNLKYHLSLHARTLVRHQYTRSQLNPDVKACQDWERYWNSLSELPETGPRLLELLDKTTIASSYAELEQLWPRVSRTLEEAADISERLAHDAAKITTHTPYPPLDRVVAAVDEPGIASIVAELSSARVASQRRLIATLKKISALQMKAVDSLKRPLAVAGDELKQSDALKGKVAQVIDIPFLYGVILIEAARREKWVAELEPINRKEAARRQSWISHYTAGSLGPMVKRLAEIDGLQSVEKVGLEPEPSERAQGTMKEARKPSIEAAGQQTYVARVSRYLAQLQRLGLTDVYEDLKSENGAMQRQLAKSIYTSVSSLVPAGSVSPSPGPDANRSSVSPPPPASAASAAYESRIRKLETMLMQSRLGNKNHELDLVRAETRATARVEAKAEVKLEQLQTQIDVLEKQNREIADRLQSYTTGLEAILNSMGLQTSRVDPDTGEFGSYRVNRVKGLSRRTSPPSATFSDQASASTSGSATSAGDAPAKPRSLERLLDQTFVDNQVLYESVTRRFGDVERLARKLQSDNRKLREQSVRTERDIRQRVALHSFRPEDLILFLPMRDPRRQPNPWAAFNAGAPHYFLHPKHATQLSNREYLIARAAEVERHVVGESDSEGSEDNPFGLPVGVEWFLISVHGEWGV